MTECRALALLPFLVKRARAIEIFRAMWNIGIDVTVAFADYTPTEYAADTMEDFITRDRLIDLARTNLDKSFEVIGTAIDDRRIDLVVQVGAASLYPNLPRWKELWPELRIADILYNQFGHSLN